MQNIQRNLQHPLVSVIIPTYNRALFVQDAINSVLTQTYDNYEIIVIDDGSNDDTGEILVNRYGKKINYVWQENHGESFARNRGVSLAKGDYVAFLDSDDVWLPDKLSQQIAVLINTPDISAVFCQIWRIDEYGQKISEIPLGVGRKSSDFDLVNMFIRNRIPGGASTCLLRRDIYEQFGGFAGDIHYGEDWELWLKIIAKFPIFFLQKPLCSYRQHNHSQSSIPNINQVNRRLEDYLTLLNRFALENPNKISETLFNRSIAYQYFNSCLASYYLGSIESGKQRFTQAIYYDPNSWLEKEVVVNIIRGFVSNYFDIGNLTNSSKAMGNFRALLVNNLPDSLKGKQMRNSISGAIKVQVGILNYLNGNTTSGAKAIMEGIRYDPSLFSFETLGILMERVFGKRIVNKMRALKHRQA